jgi:Leucine-rich repeat (LRR) protein
MSIIIEENTDYDTDVHPEVTAIHFRRTIVGNFFKDDRFPNLVRLDCYGNQLRELQVNCPSLQKLWCESNCLTTLELNCPPIVTTATTSRAADGCAIIRCPFLQELRCGDNKLTKLDLICPSLQTLRCSNNKLTKLELNCPSLRMLLCSYNKLTTLDLICPSLLTLWCCDNKLTNLNGLEYCENLSDLRCSESLSGSAEIIKEHIPNLRVIYR